MMENISRDNIYATRSHVLVRENQQLKEAEEKARKGKEWFKGAAVTVERDRAAAVVEKDKAEAALAQKEKSFNEVRTILEDNCAQYIQTIRNHDKWMEVESLKVTEARND